MASIEYRSILREEREAVLDLLEEWFGDREFFARYFRYDPTFCEDLCFVACDGGRIVSTFQVFRKTVRSRRGELQVAGVGNVFTTAAYRGRGVASQLLRYGLERLPAFGFDVSLLFATRTEFYNALGYQSHPRWLTLITGVPHQGAPSGYEIRFFRDSDLPAVRSLYDDYNRTLCGSTVRDPAYWQGQLRYAGNPQESFLLACREGTVVAYARATDLFGLRVILEHAFIPGHEDALVQLVRAHHVSRSEQLTGTLAHLEHETGVQKQLRASGLDLHRVEDVTSMWRVVDAGRLTSKLGLGLAAACSEGLWNELFPPQETVYWIADRF